jgi:hypothetical protein
MGSRLGQCSGIAFRDVYAKDERACERHIYPDPFLGTWPGVSLFISFYT